MDLEESRKKEKEAAKNEVHEAAGGLSFSRVADLNRSSILFASPHQIAMRSCPFVHSPRWTDASSHKPAAGLKALRHGAASTTLLSAALVGKSLQRVLDVYVWACSMDVDLSEQLRPRQQDPLPHAASSGAASGETSAVPARVYMAARVAIGIPGMCTPIAPSRNANTPICTG